MEDDVGFVLGNLPEAAAPKGDAPPSDAAAPKPGEAVWPTPGKAVAPKPGLPNPPGVAEAPNPD